MFRSGVALLVGVLQPCEEPPLPRAVVMVCDRSQSGDCDEDTVRSAVREFLNAEPSPESTFEVMATGCDVDDVRKVYEVRVAPPGPGLAGRRKKARAEEEARLAALTLPPRRNPCSGIAASIWKAASRLREHDGTRELIVSSDMREVSAVENLERRLPASPAAFVAKVQKAGLLGDLAGVRVTVCGVHDRSFPGTRWTAKRSQALRTAWAAAFAAMHVPDVVLRETCPWQSSAASGPQALVP